MNTTTHETEIIAPADLPTITIVREFNAPPEKVFRAWTDAELFARWVGPADISTRVQHWDPRTGGSWRYLALRGGEEIAAFYGSFHEVRHNERLVQTITFEGVPDGVSLETMKFEALADERTRVTTVGVVESLQTRDAILSSGMDVGVREGYNKLDELLATL